jgi:hypothetical protein
VTTTKNNVEAEAGTVAGHWHVQKHESPLNAISITIESLSTNNGKDLLVTEICEMSGDGENYERLANLIVTAVNSHAALVEASKDARLWIDGPRADCISETQGILVTKIENALALAAPS